MLQDPYRCVLREVDRQHYLDYVGYAWSLDRRLGEKAKMVKWQAQEKLRKEIAAATGSQPRKDGTITLEWFTEERFIPMREGN